MRVAPLSRAYRKAASSQAAIIMLTARDTIEDKAAGFDAGADDYLVKPFSLRELKMRIEALARRPKRHQDTVLSFADLTFLRGSGQLAAPGRSVKLHEKTEKLMVALMEAAPAPVSQESLSYALWGDDTPDSGALRTHIYYLRRTVADIGSTALIKTIRGKGYALTQGDSL